MRVSRSRARMLGTTVLAALGTVLLAIPVYDVWEDIYRQGEIPITTLVENALPALLAGVLIAAAFWFRTTDWEDGYVETVMKWCIVAVSGALIMHVWVLGIQLYVQDQLKPFIIAADTVVAASVAGLAVGVYSAKSAKRQDELQAERDRLSALFENTTDSIAVVEYVDGTPLIRDVNDTFETTFGVERGDIVGESIVDVIHHDHINYETTADEIMARADRGESFEIEVERASVDGPRDFLLRIVPHEMNGDTTRVYAVFTDVTERKQLDREREQRNRIQYLHRIASQMASTQYPEEAYRLTLDAAAEAFDYQRGCLLIDGELVDTVNTDELIDEELADIVRRTGSSSFERDDYDILTASIGDRGVLQLAAERGSLDQRDATALDLLTTHLTESLRRIQREHEVQDERERLEFLNRILRHNLLNGMNVVQARVELLDGHVDESAEDHRETVADRIDDMIDLIQTMRAFMQAIVDDERHELEPIDLRRVLHDEIGKARAAYDDATFEIGDLPDVQVFADDLLPEVMENLLTNAVQHNDKDESQTTVEIDVEKTADEAIVYVRDNGPGIPDSRKTEIFEKGMSGLQNPGSGFGLYLVKEIIDSYDGEITVRDAEPEGAEFTLHLPREN